MPKQLARLLSSLMAVAILCLPLLLAGCGVNNSGGGSTGTSSSGTQSSTSGGGTSGGTTNTTTTTGTTTTGGTTTTTTTNGTVTESLTTSMSSTFEMDQVLHQGNAVAPSPNIIFNGDGGGVNSLLIAPNAAQPSGFSPTTRASFNGNVAPTLGAGVTANALFAHGLSGADNAFAAPTNGTVTGGPASNNRGSFFIFSSSTAKVSGGSSVPGTPSFVALGPDVTDPVGACTIPGGGLRQNPHPPTSSEPIIWVTDPNSNVIRRRNSNGMSGTLDNSDLHNTNPPFNDDPGYVAITGVGVGRPATVSDLAVNPNTIALVDPADGNPVLPGEIVGIAEQETASFPNNVGRVWFTAPFKVNLTTGQIVQFNSIGYIDIVKQTVEDPCAPTPQGGAPAATINVSRPKLTTSNGTTGVVQAHFTRTLDNVTPAGLSLSVKADGSTDTGTIWVTVSNLKVIYRLGTKSSLLSGAGDPGQETFTYTASATGATEIAGGKDGNMYFLLPGSDQIGTVPANASPGNPLVPLSLPTKDSNGTAITPGQGLAGIILGQDNRVWFSMANSNKMGSIAPNGVQILATDVYDLGLKTQDAAGNPVPSDATSLVFPPAASTVPTTCRPGGLVNTTVKGAPVIQFILGDWCTSANFGVDGLTSELVGQINTPVTPSTANPRGLVLLGKEMGGSHRYAPTGIVMHTNAANTDFYVLTNNDGTTLRNRSNFIFRYKSDAAHLGQLVDQHDVSASFPAGSQMEQVAEDNNGNLWVTCRGLNRIVKLSADLLTANIITTTFPTEGVAIDELGNVWFTEYNQALFDPNGLTANSMVGVVPAVAGTGTVVGVGGVEIPLPNNSKPYGIAPGPATTHRMWVTEQLANAIQKVNIDTRVLDGTAIAVPTAGGQPTSIALNASNGALYFTEVQGNKVGVITASTGAVGEVAIPTSNSKPAGVAIGADNAVWFVETVGGNVGRLSVKTGAVVETIITSTNGGPTFISKGAADASSNNTMLLPLLNIDRLAVLSFKAQ